LIDGVAGAARETEPFFFLFLSPRWGLSDRLAKDDGLYLNNMSALFVHDVIVFLIGFLASFVGSVAAGAALITVPGLLLLGVAPQVALATAAVGGIGFRLGNFFTFLRHDNLGVSWRDIFIFTLIAVPATALGTSIVVRIDPEVLSKVIGVILFLMLPLLFVKDLGVVAHRAKGMRRYISHVLFFGTRVWSGFFRPGSGFVETYLRVRGYGYTLLQGKAVTRLPLILADVGSVIIFAAFSFIDLRLVIVLFLGMLVGGVFGASVAIKKGDGWVRSLLGIVIVITAIKMVLF
jgi:hypothetical protein